MNILFQYFCSVCFDERIQSIFRARKEYWQNLKPATGRPTSSSMSSPDAWGWTAGSDELKQHAETTTKEEMDHVFSKKITGITGCPATGKAI